MAIQWKVASTAIKIDCTPTSFCIPDLSIHSSSSSMTIISLSLSLAPAPSPPPLPRPYLFITIFFPVFLGVFLAKEAHEAICKGREDEVLGYDLILVSLTQLHILAAFLIHSLHILRPSSPLHRPCPPLFPPRRKDEVREDVRGRRGVVGGGGVEGVGGGQWGVYSREIGHRHAICQRQSVSLLVHGCPGVKRMHFSHCPSASTASNTRARAACFLLL